MYICICNSVSEDDILSELEANPRKSVKEIFDKLEVGHDCRGCHKLAQEFKAKLVSFRSSKKGQTKLEIS